MFCGRFQITMAWLTEAALILSAFAPPGVVHAQEGSRPARPALTSQQCTEAGGVVKPNGRGSNVCYCAADPDSTLDPRIPASRRKCEAANQDNRNPVKRVLEKTGRLVQDLVVDPLQRVHQAIQVEPCNACNQRRNAIADADASVNCPAFIWDRIESDRRSDLFGRTDAPKRCDTELSPSARRMSPEDLEQLLAADSSTSFGAPPSFVSNPSCLSRRRYCSQGRMTDGCRTTQGGFAGHRDLTQIELNMGVAEFYYAMNRFRLGTTETLQSIAEIDSLLGGDVLEGVSCQGSHFKECEQLRSKLDSCRPRGGFGRMLELSESILNARDVLIRQRGQLLAKIKNINRVLQGGGGGQGERASRIKLPGNERSRFTFERDRLQRQLDLANASISALEEKAPWILGSEFTGAWDAAERKISLRQTLTEQLQANRRNLIRRLAEYEQVGDCLQRQKGIVECSGLMDQLLKESPKSTGIHDPQGREVQAQEYLEGIACRVLARNERRGANQKLAHGALAAASASLTVMSLAAAPPLAPLLAGLDVLVAAADVGAAAAHCKEVLGQFARPRGSASVRAPASIACESLGAYSGGNVRSSTGSCATAAVLASVGAAGAAAAVLKSGRGLTEADEALLQPASRGSTAPEVEGGNVRPEQGSLQPPHALREAEMAGVSPSRSELEPLPANDFLRLFTRQHDYVWRESFNRYGREGVMRVIARRSPGLSADELGRRADGLLDSSLKAFAEGKLGQPLRDLPDVEGMTLNQARSVLRKEGFRPLTPDEARRLGGQTELEKNADLLLRDPTMSKPQEFWVSNDDPRSIVRLKPKGTPPGMREFAHVGKFVTAHPVPSRIPVEVPQGDPMGDILSWDGELFKVSNPVPELGRAVALPKKMDEDMPQPPHMPRLEWRRLIQTWADFAHGLVDQRLQPTRRTQTRRSAERIPPDRRAAPRRRVEQPLSAEQVTLTERIGSGDAKLILAVQSALRKASEISRDRFVARVRRMNPEQLESLRQQFRDHVTHEASGPSPVDQFE